MVRAVEVEPLPDFRLRLKYSNGVTGEVDLSRLVGRGVFKAWCDECNFSTARITHYGAVAWDNDIEMCADSLYLLLPGRSMPELMRRIEYTSVSSV